MHGPPERSALVSMLRKAWTDLELDVAQAHWWFAFAGHVIVWELSFLVLLCVLDAGEEAREVAILLWEPSVGLVLWAGGVCLFHMQVPKACVGPRLNSSMFSEGKGKPRT